MPDNKTKLFFEGLYIVTFIITAASYVGDNSEETLQIFPSLPTHIAWEECPHALSNQQEGKCGHTATLTILNAVFCRMLCGSHFKKRLLS